KKWYSLTSKRIHCTFFSSIVYTFQSTGNFLYRTRKPPSRS
ncbi:unnamed protein product, partial [Onchocerca ochengi]